MLGYYPPPSICHCVCSCSSPNEGDRQWQGGGLEQNRGPQERHCGYGPLMVKMPWLRLDSQLARMPNTCRAFWPDRKLQELPTSQKLENWLGRGDEG